MCKSNATVPDTGGILATTEEGQKHRGNYGVVFHDTF